MNVGEEPGAASASALILSILAVGYACAVGRETVIGFDLLVAPGVGWVVHAISARDPQRRPGRCDALQLSSSSPPCSSMPSLCGRSPSAPPGSAPRGSG